MTHVTLCYLTLILLLNLLIQPVVLAECCSSHGGICNKEKCCDDTPLPTDCGDIRLIKLPPLASLTLPKAPESSKLNKELQLPPVAPPPSWLYIWQDRQTGRRYLSSSFPPWYRNPQFTENYPTVWIYDENNRLIDNTQQKISSATSQVLRQQVEQQQQQLANYQQVQAKELQARTQQIYLADLLKRWAQQEKQWVKTQTITPTMTQLLAELVAAKEVVISMTEEQVKQAWGEPSSESVAVVNKKYVKTWAYPNGKQVTLQAGRVQALKR